MPEVSYDVSDQRFDSTSTLIRHLGIVCPNYVMKDCLSI